MTNPHVGPMPEAYIRPTNAKLLWPAPELVFSTAL